MAEEKEDICEGDYRKENNEENSCSEGWRV